MILGLGSDLVDIRRIESSIRRFGPRFLERVFTAEECREAERRAGAACIAAYAKRFAAKEAAAKALGTGFAQGVSWREIAVTALPGGQPALTFSGAAGRRLDALTPGGMVAVAHLSLSDEFPLALATVILSAIPAPGGSVP